MPSPHSSHLLIICAVFYRDIADELIKAAQTVFDNKSATYDIIEVPGVLEIPAVIAMAEKNPHKNYDGYLALGCVIRGETSHYDSVANESARALMDLSVQKQLCLANGILTVENEKQAWARANKNEKNKGGACAQTALDMIHIHKLFQL